jgi:hypothetical protein
MAAIRSYINGAGGSSGADLAVLENTYQSGNYWYLGNAVSTAADANAGTDREYPFLTLAAAYAAASARDTIVVLQNHREAVSTKVTLAKAGLNIVGEGSGTAIPRFTNGVAAATNPMFQITAASVLLDNFYFPESSVVARERIHILGGSGTSVLRNLTFDCGANDSTHTIAYSSVGPDFWYNLRFTATGTGAAYAVDLSNAGSHLVADTITFDGGSYGWGTAASSVTRYAMFGSAAVTNMRFTRVRMLNSSNVLFPTGTTGIFQVSSMTGGSRVDWTV